MSVYAKCSFIYLYYVNIQLAVVYKTYIHLTKSQFKCYMFFNVEDKVCWAKDSVHLVEAYDCAGMLKIKYVGLKTVNILVSSLNVLVCWR